MGQVTGNSEEVRQEATKEKFNRNWKKMQGELSAALASIGFTYIVMEAAPGWKVHKWQLTLTRDDSTQTLDFYAEQFNASSGMSFFSKDKFTEHVQLSVWCVSPRRTFKPTLKFVDRQATYKPINVEKVAKAFEKAFIQACESDGRLRARKASEAEKSRIVGIVNGHAGKPVCFMGTAERSPHLGLRRDLSVDEMTSLIDALKAADMLHYLQSYNEGDRHISRTAE